MNSLLVAPAIMVGIGLFFGTILAIAQRFLKVDEDPRIEGTNELLPGTNCGACGQPGCLPFAEKLVTGEVDPGQCTVSTDENIELIAEYLEVDAGRGSRRVGRWQRMLMGLPWPGRLRNCVYIRRHTHERQRAATSGHREMPRLPRLRRSLSERSVRTCTAQPEAVRAMQYAVGWRGRNATLRSGMRCLR